MNINVFSVELTVGMSIGYSIDACSHRGSRAPGRWWNCSGLDHRSEGIPRYTNAPMMVFVPEGDIGGYRRPFVQILEFLLIILARFCWQTSWKVLAWQHGLLTFHTKTKQKCKKPSNIRRNAKILSFQHFHFLTKSIPLTAAGRFISHSKFSRCC